LSVIRFFRTCISLCDMFYNNSILRHSLFEPLMKVWRMNADRYNLINSSIINLFDFIVKENMKRLIAHLVTNYLSDMEQIDYVETFHQLISLNKKNQETDESTHDSLHNDSNEEQDDGSYFGESDSEHTSQSPQTESQLQQERSDYEGELFFDSMKTSKKESEEEEDEFLSNVNNSNESTNATNNKNMPHQQQQQHITISLGISSPEQSAMNGGSPPSKKRSQSELCTDDMMLDDSTSPQKKRKLSPDRILMAHLDENKQLS